MDDALRVFESDEAARAKREIVRAARKLWLREYVDGNGGNISSLAEAVRCGGGSTLRRAASRP